MAQRALQREVDKLERRTPMLGTIASTAPFVGLLGTVIGIIKAFQSIATTKGGGPEVVAAGVAEALITTAFGLFVAIPAVMGYNYLVHRVQRLALEVQVSVSEIIDAVRKRK
jgi:biopolymer transport protein ExbB/biopolymer transport protein TolQ